MKTLLKLSSFILSGILVTALFAGCGASKDSAIGDEDYAYGMDYDNMFTPEAENGNAESPDQSALLESPFMSVSDNPVSTLSADVDTASYSYFRKLVNSGYSFKSLTAQFKTSPLRTEEMVNYFDYSTTIPENGELFGVKATIAKTPWNDNSQLLMMTLATEAVKEKGENNLVFLIDVSGSMNSKDKLPLLKEAFSSLVAALDENDTVSIVTYSGREAVVLSGCSGDKKEEIMTAVNSLEASGSTNGQAGLTKAYSLASDYFKPNGNNRIIMASDGDLNVGISSVDEIKAYISEKRESGIFLSVLGFGTGNYNDSTMSTLAENGNGVYYYIDGEREAQKIFGEKLLSTLYTVAKDVKLQLTFDAAHVEKYRLIGYESRRLDNEDFDNDQKDAGDVGAGHSVTICYELILTENADASTAPEGLIANLDMRYKLPNESESSLKSFKITLSDITTAPDSDFCFASAVIETAMILNGSKYNAKEVTLADVLTLIANADAVSDPDRQEFKAILEKIA